LATVTVNVTAVNDSPTGTVTIAGDAKVGQTLTASNTLADVDGIGAISYQWSSFDGTTTTAISGATSSTYTIASADDGDTLTVAASYTDDDGTVENISSTATTAVTTPDQPFLFTYELVANSDVPVYGSYADNPNETIIKLTLNLDIARVSDLTVDSIASVGPLDFTLDWSQIEVAEYSSGAANFMYTFEEETITAIDWTDTAQNISTFFGVTLDGSASADAFNEITLASTETAAALTPPNLTLVDRIDTQPGAFVDGVDFLSEYNIATIYLNPIDSITSLDITYGSLHIGINETVGDAEMTQLSSTLTIDII